MMPQARTEDITSGRHGGNPESEAAQADRIHRGPSQRRRVWLEVYHAGIRGVTVDELAEKWGAEVNRISGRFSELSRDGLIERRENKGKRVTRRTRSGSRAAVWFITP